MKTVFAWRCVFKVTDAEGQLHTAIGLVSTSKGAEDARAMARSIWNWKGGTIDVWRVPVGRPERDVSP